MGKSTKPCDNPPCPTCGKVMARRSKQCLACARKRPDVPQHPDPAKRYVSLTLDKLATVDLIDYERVSVSRWAAKRSLRKDGTEVFYAVRTVWIGGRPCGVQMHRFILGITDPLIQVDHKNSKETLNNCRDNLRCATPSQNQANRNFTKSASGYKGVAIVRKRMGRRTFDGWRGEITVNRKRIVGPIVRRSEEHT